MKKYYLLLVFVISNCYGIADIKSSVIIPCVARHLKYVPKLLTNLSDQTVLPFDVVISISDVEPKYAELIKLLQTKEYPFDLKLLLSSKKQSAGVNRNIAIKHSSGNFIICQDADDIPHPRRVEILEDTYRNNPNISIFIHNCIWLWKESLGCNALDSYINDYKRLDMDKFSLNATINNTSFFSFNERPDYCPKVLVKDLLLTNSVTLGNCAFPKKIFEKTKYRDFSMAEDSDFARRALRISKKKIYMISKPLLFYLVTRSSHRGTCTQ